MYLRVDDGRMSGSDIRWLMFVEWVDALGLCCDRRHWTHYQHHSPTSTRYHPSHSSPLHLYSSSLESLAPVSHHYHAICTKNSRPYTPAPTKHNTSLPLTHFLSDPLQLILFTSPLDQTSLTLFPISHSDLSPLHSKTIPPLMSAPYLHILSNFPWILTLPLSIS